MVLVVAFALDGVVFLRAACLGDEVDAGVLRRDAELGRAISLAQSPNIHT